MVRRTRLVPSLILTLLVAGTAGADEEFETLWSATLMGEFKVISDEEADDSVTGFFDQYEFTPNKSSSVPFELGIRDASYDLLGEGETPRIQIRFQSPTSNLGVSGSQIDQPFWNQRGDVYGRFDSVHLDVDYRRMRTHELRLYPTAFSGAGPPFTDLTSPFDRFDHGRTGFFSELRLRLPELTGRDEGRLDWLSPELALRGGYEGRKGQRQDRFLLDPTNDWLGLTQPLDQSVGKGGAGLFLSPGGLFSVAIDYDHKRFREDATQILQSDLGPPYPSSTRTIDFVPDTDQSTGTIRVDSHLGDRAVIEGGFQISRLQQVSGFTPLQLSSGLTDNSLLFYSANLGADVAILDHVSANAFFKFDRRDNEIQRDTALFNRTTQTSSFLDEWRRLAVGGEVVYSPRMRSVFALGARYEKIDRDIDYALPIAGNQFIPAVNTLYADRTEMYTVYGRTHLRPIKGLGVRGEIGYRGAPQTGYIVDLDKYVYGKLRASYVLPIERPVVVSAFADGGSGENRDFTMVGASSAANRDFDRYDYLWGVTVSTPLTKRATVYATFFDSRDSQDYDLVTSTVQRYFAAVADFSSVGPLDYRNDQMNFTIGTDVDLGERTDGAFSYSFTQAETRYEPGAAASQLALIQFYGAIDSDVHGLDFEIGHRLRDGVRVLVGYRLQLYSDGTPVPRGLGSAAPPFDLSMTQHAIRLGVTFTSDLLSGDE